ncbi:RecE-like recombination exonuclease [Gordonia phage Clawz]|uniref:Exonuclease n=1 Tax=Gordonia phage Clawz TaxID=2743910 RepID=A0AAE7FAH8_9CAUD|nr:RecE-like recombination exonuclease [Gordonia phage Clawz]QKY79995.1 exonuclease [Gordonia phage Clawz]
MTRASWACPDSKLILPLSVASSDRGRAEWLKGRGKGIGGSDIAALLEDSPYEDNTPWFIWKDKVDPLWREDQEKKVMTRGQKMEPLVVEEFLAEHPELTTRRQGLHQSRENPIMLANVDRLTSDGGGLECKTATSNVIRSWADKFGVGNAPEHYLDQCRWYQMVTGRSHWWLAILAVDTWDLLVWKVEVTDEQAELMTVVATEFWSTYVELGIEPDPSSWSVQEITTRFPEDDGTTVNYDPDTTEAHQLQSAITERREIDAEMKALKQRRTEIDNQLRTMAGGHAEIQVGGKKAFTWKAYTRKSLDGSALKEKEPEIWNQFAKTSEGRSLYVSASIFT